MRLCDSFGVVSSVTLTVSHYVGRRAQNVYGILIVSSQYTQLEYYSVTVVETFVLLHSALCAICRRRRSRINEATSVSMVDLFISLSSGDVNAIK